MKRRNQALLRGARRLVADAGRLIIGELGKPRRVDFKGVGDFVTDLDTRVESFLRVGLERAFPGHDVLGEEGGHSRTGSEFTWILDPIDGTTNLARGLPQFAVSVACVDRDRNPLVGLALCFPERELYWATAGGGAFRDGVRVQCPEPNRLGPRSVIAYQWRRGQRRLLALDGLLRTGCRIRNLGCTVAQICAVASGRLDANVQEHGRIWDLAAAGLIAVESGTLFTDWAGGAIFPFDSWSRRWEHPSLTAHPALHRRLIRTLAGGRPARHYRSGPVTDHGQAFPGSPRHPA